MHTAHLPTTAGKPARPFAEAQSVARLPLHVLTRLQAGEALVWRELAYPDDLNHRHALLGISDAKRVEQLVRQFPFVDEKRSSWRPFG